MRILRKVGVTLAAATLSMGLITISAPAADADSSWGSRILPIRTP